MTIPKPVVFVILGIIASLLVDLGTDGHIGYCKSFT